MTQKSGASISAPLNPYILHGNEHETKRKQTTEIKHLHSNPCGPHLVMLHCSGQQKLTVDSGMSWRFFFVFSLVDLSLYSRFGASKLQK